MSARKTPAPQKTRTTAPPNNSPPYRQLLWLIFFANSLFLIPQCLDYYLAPRFLFLSVVLLAGLWLLRRELRARADWRLHGFDLLLLAWYGLGLASISWAYSWSESVFFSQKVLLLFLTYWLVRQALQRDEGMVRRTLAQATVALTFLVGAMILVQLVWAFSQKGLNNEALYDYASGVFGNKGLASDFLFFLLIFNVLFYPEIRRKAFFWGGVALLLALILLLQTRTVYLAVAAGALLYFPLRAATEPAFRPVFWKKILPAGVLALSVLAALVAFKGQGSTLAERLNPATYLESASANERRFVWYKTDLLNQDHYWWGVGNGSWKIWFPSKSIQGGYRLEEKSVVFTRAHNDYLEVRAELGIVGFVLFCGLFVVAFGLGIWGAVAKRNLDPVLLAGLFGYCIIQYFDFPRERIELQVVLAMLFAFIAFHTRALWDALPGLNVEKWAGGVLNLAFLGLAFNVLIGFHRVSGEIHNMRMMKAMAHGDYPAVLREAGAARNMFYEYNEVALPLQWYEGIAHLNLKQYPQAVADLEMAYRLNPWSFQVLNNYASALAMNRQHRDALPIFKQMLEINPRYTEGKLNLAYILFELGDYAQAADWARQLDTIPNPHNAEERDRNRMILQKKAEFEKKLRLHGY